MTARLRASINDALLCLRAAVFRSVTVAYERFGRLDRAPQSMAHVAGKRRRTIMLPKHALMSSEASGRRGAARRILLETVALVQQAIPSYSKQCTSGRAWITQQVCSACLASQSDARQADVRCAASQTAGSSANAVDFRHLRMRPPREPHGPPFSKRLPLQQIAHPCATCATLAHARVD